MYVPSHEELGKHPKTKRAARALGVSLPTMVGHLQFLWWWALHYAPDGDVTQWENADLADAALWEGDPNLFVEAITNCNSAGGAGFLEETAGRLVLHHWNEQGGGKLLQAREKHAEVMRNIRGQSREPNVKESDSHVIVTRQSRDDLKESKLKENLTPPISPPSNGSNKAMMATVVEHLPRTTDRILTKFESEAADLLGKVLTHKQRDVICGFRNELGASLTEELIDYGFEAAALQSGDRLSYVFQTIRNKIAGKGKPGTNGNGSGDTLSDEVYSFDTDKAGRRIPLSGNPDTGELPYRARDPAEVMKIHNQKKRERRNGGLQSWKTT